MTQSLLSSSPPFSAPLGPGAAFLRSATRLPCRIVVSWSLAGGLIAGGFLVALVTLWGNASGNALPELTVLFFALGVGAGVAHGGLLGFLARDPSRPPRALAADLARSLVWAVPAVLVTAMVTLWISLSGAVFGADRPPVLDTAMVFLAWFYGLAVCAWAAWEGAHGLAAAFRRRPDLRTASWIVSAVFAALLTVFLTSPPEIWFTDLRVNNAGAVVLAFGASVWIALPVAIAGLALLHRLARRG